MSDLDDLYDRRVGVVARHQLLDLGVPAHSIRRMLRREQLVQKLPGVYLNHTGDPTWLQRSWIAILFLGDAALCHASAIRADDGPGRAGADDDVIHVAVDRTRSPAAPPGVRLHQLAHLDDKVRWNASPPRVRIEHAVVDVAAEARDDMRAIAALADAVQALRTTASRLLEVVQGRSRLARRQLLLDVLTDIASGTHSALEHAYLVRVERAHGLPAGSRQVAGTWLYRDVALCRLRHLRRAGRVVVPRQRVAAGRGPGPGPGCGRRGAADGAAGVGAGGRAVLRDGHAGRCDPATTRLDRGGRAVPGVHAARPRGGVLTSYASH